MTVANTISRLEARKIRSRLSNINPSNSSPQNQSDLFGKIPPEIRNLIFRYALQGSQSYSECRYCASKSHDALQKGVKHRRLVDIALLQTCRIGFYETAGLPLRLTTLHGCLGSLNRLRHRILTLTAMNVLDLHEVHLNGHGLTGLLDELGMFSRLPQFQPSHLTLRINVDISRHWLSQLHCGLSMQGTFPLSLQTLCLQFRTGLLDPAVWQAKIESLYPLQLILGGERKLVQSEQALRSTLVNQTSTTLSDSLAKFQTAAILLVASGPAHLDTLTSAHGYVGRKVTPHCNLIIGMEQMLWTTPI